VPPTAGSGGGASRLLRSSGQIEKMNKKESLEIESLEIESLEIESLKRRFLEKTNPWK
jgi:hypothetical protein